MTHGTLDDKYFEWLYSLVGSVRNRNPSRSHWKLLKQLYSTPFEWSVPNDDNRVEDGCDLRWEFLGEAHVDDPDPVWMGLQCSMLEMLLGLARRAAFESPGGVDEWFWKFMQNLDLRGYTDVVYNSTIAREVGNTLHRVIYRTYSPDGSGGIFPLNAPHYDQRRIELWHQLSAYLLEGDYIDHGPAV